MHQQGVPWPILFTIPRVGKVSRGVSKLPRSVQILLSFCARGSDRENRALPLAQQSLPGSELEALQGVVVRFRWLAALA